MKILSYLLGGALLWAAPVQAQSSATPAKATPAKSVNAAFGAAQKTWHEVRDAARELDDFIAAHQLAKVHDAALGLRDTVRELRFGWNALPASRQASIDVSILKIDGLLDDLHENADNNNLPALARDQRLMHVLLDQIALGFPRGTLKPVGPVTQQGDVKDPFCRMTVDAATAAAKVAVGGQTYYFCSLKESLAFKKNPSAYIALYDQLAFGAAKKFEVKLSTPVRVTAGKAVPLRLEVRERGQQTLITRFQPVHEKLMHLIVISDDLSWFRHEHPHFRADGRFSLSQIFPRDGRYFLFSDFTPASGTNQIVKSTVRVGSGVTRAPQPLRADVLGPNQTLSKLVDGIQIDLKLSAPLQADKQALLTYSLSKNGRPVTNMVPYLAAMGHMIAISQDARQAVHTHTVSAGSDPRTGLSVSAQMSTAHGPQQSFKLELPTGGLYRIWAQFGLPGRVLTVPFTFQVQENPMKNTKVSTVLAAAALSGTILGGVAAHAAPPSKVAPLQKITISLPVGYKTGAATVKAGTPVALTFLLKSEAGCGDTISVPAAKWKRSLTVGQKATLVYTPKKSGPLAFECGMGMMKGTLTVK